MFSDPHNVIRLFQASCRLDAGCALGVDAHVARIPLETIRQKATPVVKETASFQKRTPKILANRTFVYVRLVTLLA
jgi:hypothetical protein